MTHRRVPIVAERWFPAYVIWELTLRCNHACHHCGSRAGVARPGELDTDEAVRVVHQLADQGAREVVLLGGEAHLHPGFLQVVSALRDRGVARQLTTGGRDVTPELARAMAAAGLQSASVSVDGLEPTHDRIRNAAGSHRDALGALRALRAAGIRTGSTINLNRANRGELEQLYPVLREAGISGWQVQLTAPLGRAADRTDLVLQPYDLLELLPRIAKLKERAYDDGILIMPGNNLGYFGPEEALLRSYTRGAEDHFAGCQAGRLVLGIESQGDLKGCLSLPSAAYVGGNVRDRAVADIWRDTEPLGFARSRTRADLWGFCQTCDFAESCFGGCTFTAHALLGRAGNNPYCHFRARTLRKRGRRERLVPVAAAAGLPFDTGRFELLEEAFDAPEVAAAQGDALVRVTSKPQKAPARP
ncbi:MAG: radical SAM protein [Polyangiaceae bacterium]|nr:radical SAM protein [Polyangiaceae bacterium]